MSASEINKQIRKEYDKSRKILEKLLLGDQTRLRQRVSEEITKLKDEYLDAAKLSGLTEATDDSVFLLFFITPDQIIKIYHRVSCEGDF